MGKLTAKPPKPKAPKEQVEKDAPLKPPPDEFVSLVSKGVEEARSHRTPILVGIGAALVAVVVSWGVSKMAESKKEHASHQLGRALKIYSAPLKDAPEDPAAALTGQDPADASDDLPRFKTAQERLDATLKELDAVVGSAPEPTVHQARLARAGVLVDLGRYDEAITAYDAYLKDARGDSHLKFLARKGKAVALEAKGNLDGAIAELKTLETEAPFLQARAQYQQARLLLKKGNKAEGEKLLKGILEKFPGSSLRDEISARLSSLEG